MGYSIAASDQATEEQSQTPTLDQPYLGPAHLVDVRKESYGSNGEYPVLVFEFEALGPNEVNGYSFEGTRLHRHSEFPITEDDMRASDDGASSAQKEVDRIAWILGYFMDEEEAEAAVKAKNADSLEELWETIRTQVVATAEAVDYEDKNIKIKVLAEEYNGEGKIQTPFYKGWLADENSEQPLTFSQQDKRNLRDWERIQNASPNGEPATNGETAGGDNWDW
jgi:hypothetical protein